MTAEFAAAIPAVVLVIALALGGLQLSTRRIQAQDAAALAARSAARDSTATARALVQQVLPGATLNVQREGELLCAVVRAPTASGGGPLGPLLATLPVAASSCALAGGR